MKPIVYVGEGAPVFDRIQSHNESKYKKDFWNRAIVFSSKDDYLTKTQIQYLESKLVSEINKIQGAIAENIQLSKSQFSQKWIAQRWKSSIWLCLYY